MSLTPEDAEKLRQLLPEMQAHANATIEQAKKASRADEAETKLAFALSDIASLFAEQKMQQIKLDETERKLRAANQRMGSMDRERLQNNAKWSEGGRLQYQFSTYLAEQLLIYQKIANVVCYHPVNSDTCGVCGKHYWECDDFERLAGEDEEYPPFDPAKSRPSCPGGQARALLNEPPGEEFSRRAYAIERLRFLYQQMVAGEVTNTKEAAEGILGPAITGLKRTENMP